MSVGLAEESCVVPPLDGTPCELVAALGEALPVSGTLDLVGVDSLAQLKPGRVHGVNGFYRIAELIDLGPGSNVGSGSGSSPKGIGGTSGPGAALVVLKIVVAILIVLSSSERIFRRLAEAESASSGGCGRCGAGSCYGGERRRGRGNKVPGILGVSTVPASKRIIRVLLPPSSESIGVVVVDIVVLPAPTKGIIVPVVAVVVKVTTKPTPVPEWIGVPIPSDVIAEGIVVVVVVVVVLLPSPTVKVVKIESSSRSSEGIVG